MERKMVPVYLKLPEEMSKRIDQLAKEGGYSRCAYVRQIVRRYLVYLDHQDDPMERPIDWTVNGRFP